MQVAGCTGSFEALKAIVPPVPSPGIFYVWNFIEENIAVSLFSLVKSHGKRQPMETSGLPSGDYLLLVVDTIG